MTWRRGLILGGLVMVVAAILLAQTDHPDPADRYCQVDTSQQGYWCSRQPVEWVPTGTPTPGATR